MTTFADKRSALDRIINLMEVHSTNRRVTVDWTEAELSKIAKHEEANIWRYRDFELVARVGK